MVSVIVPVYNAEKYIRKCVDSILNQNDRDFELILVNDGSRDNSLAICREFEALDSRVKVIDQNNAGVSVARQNGIDAAKGEWISFVDADDYLENGFIEDINNCEENVDIIVFGKNIENTCVVKSDSKVICNILGYKTGNVCDNAHMSVLLGKAYKADIIKNNNVKLKTGIINGEDMLFNIEYFFTMPVVKYIKKEVYNYRINAGSATVRIQPEIIKNDREFLSYLKNIIDEGYNSGREYMEDLFRKVALNGMWICLRQYIAHPQNKMKKSEKIKLYKELLNSEYYYSAFKNYKAYCNDKRKRIVFMLLGFKCYSMAFLLIGASRNKKETYENIVRL